MRVSQTFPVKRLKIWIDLDNTPHIPFFIPIKTELERRGYTIVLTARDAFQVCSLADLHGLHYRKIGHHYGKHITMKLFGLAWRTLQLLPFYIRERPTIALSHGARSQILLSNIVRVPSVLIMDYEYTGIAPLCKPKWAIFPEAVPTTVLPFNPKRVRHYPGIKEDVYAQNFLPDPSIYAALGLESHALIVTVRPPAGEAHYHNPESDVLFFEIMNHLTSHPEVRTVLLPRNKKQEDYIRASLPKCFEKKRVIVPSHAIDGLQLLWHSDLVISGGGTMNREAAALGIPVYSIFRGKTGAVDRQLEAEGRLVMIRSVQEVRERINLHRRDKFWKTEAKPRPALSCIVDHVESIIRLESGRGGKLWERLFR